MLWVGMALGKEMDGLRQSASAACLAGPRASLGKASRHDEKKTDLTKAACQPPPPPAHLSWGRGRG